MAIPWIFPVRAVQVLFGIIVLGLTAYVVSVFHAWWAYSNTVNFLLFLACWTTFIATPYLTAAPIWAPRFAHPLVIPVVEVITMIFWFAGFIAMGAKLPRPEVCVWSACHALQAATVFGAFEWVLFAGTTYFAVVDLMHHRNTGESTQKTQHNAHLGV
ncbi:hypothetical protein N7492_000808 [Penicillium capsulatum]|uniref:MARVEL domain-containing protein n=1 Tax=Penicillium capsulatum TaxID=69766 RepID=A0A9W9ISL8_9EURO|nr:hypothetical protein N7492_000808 [Penicillium capsulatum]KAJ6130133.1 hypothetical protein N7512_002913 [Penicillium capsulatum]